MRRKWVIWLLIYKNLSKGGSFVGEVPHKHVIHLIFVKEEPIHKWIRSYAVFNVLTYKENKNEYYLLEYLKFISNCKCKTRSDSVSFRSYISSRFEVENAKDLIKTDIALIYIASCPPYKSGHSNNRYKNCNKLNSHRC